MNLLKDIRDAINTPEKVPPGFKTSSQWADEWGLSVQQTTKLLREGIRLKKVKSIRLKTVTASGLRPVAHYAAITA